MTSNEMHLVHTKGPWEADDSHIRTSINSIESENAVRKHIAMVNYAKNIEYEITLQEHYANAQLIAAAPDMLKALCWLSDEMDSRGEGCDSAEFTYEDFEIVRRAIKLATEGDHV